MVAKLSVAAVLHPAATTGLLAAGRVATIDGTFSDAVQSSSWPLFAPATAATAFTSSSATSVFDVMTPEASSAFFGMTMAAA